jgi:hypothetical protein
MAAKWLWRRSVSAKGLATHTSRLIEASQQQFYANLLRIGAHSVGFAAYRPICTENLGRKPVRKLVKIETFRFDEWRGGVLLFDAWIAESFALPGLVESK